MKHFTAMCATLALLFSVFATAQAVPTEGDLNTFKIGSSMSTYAAMPLSKQQNGAYILPFSWDGYALTAVLTTAKDKLESVTFMGDMANGLIGMFVNAMFNRNYMPIQVNADGKVTDLTALAAAGKSREACREFAMDSMGAWAGGGKESQRLIFFPDAAFDAISAAQKAGNDSTEVLKPWINATVFTLKLERKDDKLYFVISSLGDMGKCDKSQK